MFQTSDHDERYMSFRSAAAGRTLASARPAPVRHRHSLSVLAADAVVPAVRHAVADTLRAWGLPSDGDALAAVELVASELVTNAVRHAGGLTPRIVVTMEVRAEGQLGFGVGDEHPGTPAVAYASKDAERGRGLAIASFLAAELGGTIAVERHRDGGKTVWAEFPGLLADILTPAGTEDAPRIVCPYESGCSAGTYESPEAARPLASDAVYSAA